MTVWMMWLMKIDTIDKLKARKNFLRAFNLSIALFDVPDKGSQTQHLGVLVNVLECRQQLVDNGVVNHCDDA